MGIRLLGNVEVHGEAGGVRPARAGERCVLATLALHPGRAVTAATLADNIWSSAAQSDKTFATVADYVRKVRGALKKAGCRPESLHTDRGARSYVLDVDPMEVDYLRFAALVADDEPALALELWHGPALADVTGLWAESRRYAMEVERVNAYDKVLTRLLAAGQSAEVARTVTGLIDEIVPTDRLLLLGAKGMLVSGQQGAIRGWIDRAARRMRETVGAGPSPELLAKIDRLAERPHSVLRRDANRIVGREEELDCLAREAETGAVHVIDGMAGVGKTAFCAHFAHQIGDCFPDGKLFVELHGHTPGQQPVTPGDALTSLLLATGVDVGVIPSRLDDRARLWRHRSAGRRMLVVLDDAASHDQVRPLLPETSGSLVLITSRRRLPALDRTVPMTLDVLPTDQAVQMLSRLARIGPQRHDLAAAEEVVRLCGHLPLAIAMAASRLVSHPTWEIRYLADQLADPCSRLDRLAAGDRSVAAAFDMSVRTLPDEQRTLLHLLATHPSPVVDEDTAATLLGCSLTHARRCLESLHADHLVREAAPGRYRLHDLMRLYARQICAADRIPA